MPEAEVKSEEPTDKGGPPPVKLAKPTFVKLDDLNPNALNKGFNILTKVVSGPTVRINREYLDGSKLLVSSYLVGDKTGTMELHLKNDQIEQVKVDDVLILRNASVRIGDGHMYLKIDEWGRIEVAKPEQYKEEIKLDNKLSEVEWELVEQNN